MSKLVSKDHPALHTIAEEVPREDIGSTKIQKIIQDMKKALYSYEAEGFSGVAIAAPQIGVSLRIFIVHDTSAEKKDEKRIPDLVAINPKLIKTSKKKHVVGEGCLSVPDSYGAVERSTQATLRAYDEHGKEYERGASGLLAQIFQHEVDHLDGTLFVDRAQKIWNKEEFESQPRELKEAEVE
jgi:peptide deformylase